ncbi:TELO2-interacting protein 1 homolog [Diadema antillarum]|uniref:TELO2-interacting protein 1 homolog n=1 Tax=Diadema antillarum TaxID=105358 RepID=UPI003A85CA43
MDRNKEAFEAMKPLCVVLLKEHTLERVMAVARTVADLDPDALQSLQQYILFPLRVMLKDQAKLAAGVGEAGVRCMQLVLSRTTVGNWEMFSDLFTVLCVMISSKDMCGRASDASEELKLAVVQTLAALLISADADLLMQLYSPKSIAMLGHCVSLLLSLAEHERMRALQVASIECLTRFVPDDEQSHAVVYRAASQAFASFLPGLSVALSRVITGDQKQGQAVTVSAIECWARHVAMVMDDGLLAPTKEATPQRDAATKPASDKGPQSLLVEKSESWVRDSAAKLDMLIDKIVAMVTSRSWKVRMALVSFAERLIMRTKSSMACSMSKLLEVLVNLTQDSYDQIASKSLTILRSLAKQPLTAESRLLSELLEDGMHRLVTTLPRIIRTADDETKLSTVDVMTGYIKLLGHRLNCLLYSAPHLKRLSVALIQVLELDIRDVSILESRTLPADSADLSAPDGGFNNHLLRTFKHFSDFRIYQQITHLCQLMGQYGNVSLLVDNFLSYFQELPSHAHQAVMIISEIMRGTLLSAAEDHGKFSIWDGDKGATEEEVMEEKEEEEEAECGRNVEELQCVCRMLLDEYRSPSYWDLPTSVGQSHTQTSSPRQHFDPAHLMMMPLTSSDSLTVAEMNRNTVLKCLLLEGIAVLAQVLGPQFNLMLMHCLYPVLERLADDRSVICQSAHSALLSLSQSCGYRCIAELLYENVDYLTDSVSSRLRHYEWNLKAPLVLKVTLRYSNPDILPLLQDTIDEVLLILDSYHGDHASSLMSVLQALVQAIRRWFPVENSVEELQTVESCDTDPVDDIRAFLQDYVEKLNIADGEVRDCDVDLDQGDVEGAGEGQETSPDNIDEPKELPLHISNTKKVLERCVHLLSSSNPRLRLCVLSTVKTAVEVLAANQDVLLPLVHKLWPAFVRRFSDPEVLVINKAFETLLTLAETSRDFIRRRTVKDVWPKLIKLLEAHAETSSKAGSSYHHTAYYKLQHSILSGIGQLCIQVDIAENELLSMVQACVPYLHTGQPQGLQEACLASFECFIQADPDAVWFTLQEIYCPSPLRPPHTCFPEIKFAGESVQKKEEWVNVQKLLR